MAPSRKYCSVYGCLNSTLTKPNSTFFFLPEDAERRCIWLRLISREDLMDHSHRSHRVCEQHFNTNDILPGRSRKLLKKYALPTLHLPETNGETQVIAFTQILNSAKTQEILTEVKNKTTPSCESISTISQRKRKLLSNVSACKTVESNDTGDLSENVQQDTFHKLCDKFLTEELATLVKAQTNLNYHYTENTYKKDYIKFCLNFYYTSPQAYRLLQRALCMPCQSTLFTHYIPITSGINERVMLALRTKVGRMSEQEKNCSILVDARSLKANLFYNIKEDKIIGFHEIEGLQTTAPAQKCLVVFIRGINSDWKQPIAYALLSQCRNYDEIASWIDGLLQKLFDCGLNIRTFVSDMSPYLFQAAKKWEVSINKPYFFVNKRKIYYVFDAPYLITSVRNNLMQYHFNFNDRIAKYDHILQFYEQDKEKSFRLAPKLTKTHICETDIKKLNVWYATQLLSNTVATGIATYVDLKAIDDSGRHTAELLRIMNNLFDVLNSSNLRHDYEYRRAFCGAQSQISFFKEMLAFFQCLQITNPENGRNVTSDMKFIQGFQITIQSILLLFEDLKLEGYDSLFTRRLNQDPIDYFFNHMRTMNGLTTEPTSRQFVSAFRKQFLNNIIKPPKGANCSGDLGKVLIQNHRLEPQNNEQSLDEQNDDPMADIADVDNITILRSDYTGMNIPEKYSFIYVCGYLLKKCGEIHDDCHTLRTYMKPTLEQRIYNFSTDTRYLRYKDYSKHTCSNLLVVPPDDFVNYIEQLEDSLKTKHKNCSILASVFNEMKELSMSPLPCPCFPKHYLMKLFIRMRIFQIIKANNKSFPTGRNTRKCFTISTIKR